MAHRTRLGSFLKDMTLKDYITACAKGALEGQTPISLRRYSFSFDEVKKQVVLKAEVDRELTETERENLAVAETEIYSDFGDETLVETLVEIVPLDEPLRPLSGGIAYLREGEQTGA